jgi:Arc/MetJ family transcription regulator
MRTTIRLDDHLLAEAKKLAAEKGKRLTAIIEDGLRQALAQRRQSNRRSKVRLTTFGGKGLQRQVDLDDTASLLDRMERLDAAH